MTIYAAAIDLFKACNNIYITLFQDSNYIVYILYYFVAFM